MRAARSTDSGASDMVGTILLVALVVALGGLVALVVAHALEAPAAPRAAFSLAAPSSTGSNVSVLYRNGPPLPLSELAVFYVRGSAAPVQVARASWIVPNATRLAPGDSLAFPVSPAWAAGERIEVRVVDLASNSLLGILARTAPTSTSGLASTTLLPSVASSLASDGTSGVLVTVRATQPTGGLGVAAVSLDATNISLAAGVAPVTLSLSDSGTGGDVLGGDGIWSGLLVPSARTPGGTYTVTINATDVGGALSGTATLPVTLVNANGISASTGARLRVPTSVNVTSFRIENFTLDKLHPTRIGGDIMALRLVNGTRAWSAVLSFNYANCGGAGSVACVTAMDIWNDANETTYAPRNNTNGIPLAGLSLDMLHPVTSLQWTASGSADPTALYPASAALGSPTLLVSWMGEQNTKGSSLGPLDAGLMSVDILVS